MRCCVNFQASFKHFSLYHLATWLKKSWEIEDLIIQEKCMQENILKIKTYSWILKKKKKDNFQEQLKSSVVEISVYFYSNIHHMFYCKNLHYLGCHELTHRSLAFLYIKVNIYEARYTRGYLLSCSYGTNTLWSACTSHKKAPLTNCGLFSLWNILVVRWWW